MQEVEEQALMEKILLPALACFIGAASALGILHLLVEAPTWSDAKIAGPIGMFVGYGLMRLLEKFISK